MNVSELIENKSNFKLDSNDICENLYKGACVKIKNSQKTFQVVGMNPENEICWIREWPFALEARKTFSLDMSQITIKTFCPNRFRGKLSV